MVHTIYSFFVKGCLTNGENLTRQCRKLSWVMVVFTVAWVNLKVFQRGGKKQQTRIRSFSFLVAESPLTLIEQSKTLTTHNANRHCRVRIYTFVRQPLSKQLYRDMLTPKREGHRASIVGENADNHGHQTSLFKIPWLFSDKNQISLST